MPSLQGRPLVVMLIDDGPSDRVIFREILQAIDSSIHYIALSGGKEAIAWFSQKEIKLPDYIFLDVNMPGMDGIETLRELKKIEHVKPIPVFMYSTGHPTSYQEVAMLLGAQACITKNIDLNSSIEELTSFLNSLPARS